MQDLMKLFVVASLLLATVVTARTVQMSPGESMNLNGTWVICGGQPSGAPTPTLIPDEKCDGFYSDSSCQNAPIGQVCLAAHDRKGVCVRTSNFAGKPNCACK